MKYITKTKLKKEKALGYSLMTKLGFIAKLAASINHLG